MLIGLQVLTRILNSKDLSVVKDSKIVITPEYFTEYQEQYKYIQDYYDKYGVVPDKLTFLSKYPNLDIEQTVDEPNESLRDNLINSYKYSRVLDVFRSVSTSLSPYSVDEIEEYILDEFANIKKQTYIPKDSGVIESIDDRINNYEFVNQNQSANFIPTGFDEIDKDIVGWQRGEELVVIYARTNQGKSWVLEAMCTHAVEQGYKVGYFSPEMSRDDIGYRFDTLHGNLSNSAMKFGKASDEFNIDVYRKYGENLKQLSGEIYVSTPSDFARKLTVSKLKDWIKKRSLDMVAIDGITYLTDERFKKGDSKTISLTNISEDLMELSAEMKVPVLVVVQANRGGVVDKSSLDTPELENIRDSDGIAMNASKVYAVRQVKNDGQITLLIDNKKMRTGIMGQSYSYVWDIDIGKFEYIDKANIKTDEGYTSPKKEKKELTAGKKSTKREVDVEDDY